MIIKLTPSEIVFGVTAAAHRKVKAMSDGNTDQRGCDRDGQNWDLEIEGVLSELATAKALRRYWMGMEILSAPVALDVDIGIEVRWTRHAKGHLLIRPGDKRATYFLAVGGAGVYKIAGFIFSDDAKKPEWEKAPNGRPPAWFVPQSDLRPVEDFPLYRERLKPTQAC